MDEAIPRGDTRSAYRVGPDAAGATSEPSPQGDPGGARRRPRLRYLEALHQSRVTRLVPMFLPTPGPGTDGNHSCGFGDGEAAGEDTAASFHSWINRPSIPPATVTTWPVTWPERT